MLIVSVLGLLRLEDDGDQFDLGINDCLGSVLVHLDAVLAPSLVVEGCFEHDIRTLVALACDGRDRLRPPP